MHKIATYLKPNLGHFFFIIFFMAQILTNGLLDDGDTGYHIRAGEIILNTFEIPRLDPFSFIEPPLKWTAHEWLSEVIMAGIHRLFDLTGVVIFFSFFLSFTFYLFYILLRLDHENILVLWPVALIAVGCTTFHWLARPHVFSFIFIIIWHYILERYQYKNKNYLYFLPLSMILWVNLHGGYIIGFVLIGIYFISNLIDGYLKPEEDKNSAKTKIKNFIVYGLACLLASLINPFGYKILFFPFNLVNNKFLMANVGEFMATNLQIEHPFKYFLFFTLVVLMKSKRRLNTNELMIFILFTYMALYSVRYTTIFTILCTPILLKHLNEGLSLPNYRVIEKLKIRSNNIANFDSKNKGYIWPILIVIVVLFLAKSDLLNYRFKADKYPVNAVNFILKERIPGNMFNNDEFGDYLIYKAYPNYKVFFDGRIDMYGTDHVKNFLKVIKLEPNWGDVIELYNIGWVFHNADSLLSRYLYERPDWHLIYADDTTHIYVKNTPVYQNLIERYKNVEPSIFKKEKNLRLKF